MNIKAKSKLQLIFKNASLIIDLSDHYILLFYSYYSMLMQRLSCRLSLNTIPLV